MRLVVNLLHLPHGQLRIPLRSRQTLMPQHLLDRPQIRPLLQHVRPKRMPQRMRMHIRRQPPAQRNRFTILPTLRVVSLPHPRHAPRNQSAAAHRAPASPSPPPSSFACRNGRYARTASAAASPNGTSRSFFPLPNTRIASSFQWIASISNPTSSELRIPHPYSNSKITRSRSGQLPPSTSYRVPHVRIPGLVPQPSRAAT